MSKKLVAYFSASGVTAKVAERLSESIGAISMRSLQRYATLMLTWTGGTKLPAVPSKCPIRHLVQRSNVSVTT